MSILELYEGLELKEKYILTTELKANNSHKLRNWYATDRNEQKYFLKCFNIKNYKANSQRQIQKEIKNYERAKDNKVFYYEPQNPNYQILVIQYSQKGSLAIKIKDSNAITSTLINLLIDYSQALYSLHQKGLIHTDIQAEHLYITSTCGKIGNIGLAVTFQQAKNILDPPGHPKYMPLQMYSEDHFDSSADIWQLGIVFLQCMLRKRIHQILSDNNLVQNQASLSICTNPKLLQKSINQVENAGMKNLLKKMLTINKKDRRINMKQVLQQLNIIYSIMSQTKQNKLQQEKVTKIQIKPTSNQKKSTKKEIRHQQPLLNNQQSKIIQMQELLQIKHKQSLQKKEKVENKAKKSLKQRQKKQNIVQKVQKVQKKQQNLVQKKQKQAQVNKLQVQQKKRKKPKMQIQQNQSKIKNINLSNQQPKLQKQKLQKYQMNTLPIQNSYRKQSQKHFQTTASSQYLAIHQNHQYIQFTINLNPNNIYPLSEQQSKKYQQNKRNLTQKKEDQIPINLETSQKTTIKMLYSFKSDAIYLLMDKRQGICQILYSSLPKQKRKYFSTMRNLYQKLRKSKRKVICVLNQNYISIKMQVDKPLDTSKNIPTYDISLCEPPPTNNKEPTIQSFNSLLYKKDSQQNKQSKDIQKNDDKKPKIKQQNSILNAQSFEEQMNQNTLLVLETMGLQNLPSNKTSKLNLYQQEIINNDNFTSGYQYEQSNVESILQKIQSLQVNGEVSLQLGILYGQLGNLYSEASHFSKAKDYNQTAIRYMQITGAELSVIANTWHNLGNCYQQLNLYQMAVNCYVECNQIRDVNKIKNISERTKTDNSLATCCIYLKNYSFAESTFESLIAKLQNNFRGDLQEVLGGVLCNYGNLLTQMNNSDRAIEKYDQAIRIFQKIKGKYINIAKIRINVIGLLINSGRLKQGLFTIEICFQLFASRGDTQAPQYFMLKQIALKVITKVMSRQCESEILNLVLDILTKYITNQEHLIRKVEDLLHYGWE